LCHIRNNDTTWIYSIDKQNPFYNIQSEVNPNIYYKFYIMCRDLYVFKIQNINGVDRVIFSITLSPNNSNDIINLEKNRIMVYTFT